MRSLVIGAGQIGTALQQIFSKTHPCELRDVQPIDFDGTFDYLHIAFPYDESFSDWVTGYVKKYNPKLTLIHSSVAIGTTEKLGRGFVHTPERGRHPNLQFEMRAFTKFVGGDRLEDVAAGQKFFDACDWANVPVHSSRLTELCKLLSNVHLGLEIAWRQEVDRILASLVGGDPEVNRFGYEEWERSYNKGHEYLGQNNLVRPQVRPAPIGGHCILPCTQILAEQFESKAFEFIGRSNEKRQAEEQGINGSTGSTCSGTNAKN